MFIWTSKQPSIKYFINFCFNLKLISEESSRTLGTFIKEISRHDWVKRWIETEYSSDYKMHWTMKIIPTPKLSGIVNYPLFNWYLSLMLIVCYDMEEGGSISMKGRWCASPTCPGTDLNTEQGSLSTNKREVLFISKSNWNWVKTVYLIIMSFTYQHIRGITLSWIVVVISKSWHLSVMLSSIIKSLIDDITMRSYRHYNKGSIYQKAGKVPHACKIS